MCSPLVNGGSESDHVTVRGPMGGEFSPAPPADTTVTRAVSVCTERPGSEDTGDCPITEIIEENETIGDPTPRVSVNSVAVTTSELSAECQASCGGVRTGTRNTTMPDLKTDSSGFKRNSFLRRSDSYRRAKNILSPDLNTNNRKSVELSNNNNSQSRLSQSPLITSPAPVKQQQDKTKNNFFRSLRSSLSFSSLRVKKCQQRPQLHISRPLETDSQVIISVLTLSPPTSNPSSLSLSPSLEVSVFHR